MLRRSGGSRHIAIPNFLETVPSMAEILQLQSNLVISPHSVQSIFLARGEVGEITRHPSMGRGGLLPPPPIRTALE